jgi:hypothetical protein
MLVVGLALVTLFGYIKNYEPSPESKAKSVNFEAYFYCQEFVKRKLTAPATADFASFGESRVVPMGNSKFSVVTHVDAQNSFGAKVRSVCICDLLRLGEDSWREIAVVVQ